MDLKGFTGAVGLHAPTVALTLAVGAVGGAVARALHLPLPWLLGAMLAVAVGAILGWQPLGRPLQMAMGLRKLFVPVIGVSIGASFTPDLIRAVPGWWPALLGLVAFIPLVHQVAWRIALLAVPDRAAAWYGTAPGGSLEAIEMADAAGADLRLVTMLQFLRLSLTILLVPLGFTWLTGHAVGSGAGVSLGSPAPLGLRDVAVLAAAGVIGAVAGLRSGLPAGLILGPMLVSGAVHLAGWVEGAPPRVLIGITQWIVGVTLGVRFVGMNRGQLGRAMAVSLAIVVALIAMAGAAAWVLSRVMDQPLAGLFLAFAPGGLAEMSLIALSLHVSVIFVTAHHVLRIFLAVIFARIGGRWAGIGPKK